MPINKIFLNQNVNQGNTHAFVNGNNRGDNSLTNSQNIISTSEYEDGGPINPAFTMFPYILEIAAERFVGAENNCLYRLFNHIRDFRNGNKNDSTLTDYMIPAEYLEVGLKNAIFRNIQNLFTISADCFVDGASNIYYKTIQYIKYLIYAQILNNQGNNQNNNLNNNVPNNQNNNQNVYLA